MGANPDQQVDPAALRLAAKGLNDTISELSSLGFDEAAEMGRGFSQIELTSLDLGHAGLTSALRQFGDRWSWGVRALVHDGNEFAGRLGLAAGLSSDNDHYLGGTFKDLVSDAMGNPETSDAQVEKESWQQVWHDNPITQMEHPESQQAAAQALSHARETAVSEAKDVAASGPFPGPGFGAAAGVVPGAEEKWAKLLGSPSGHDNNGGQG